MHNVQIKSMVSPLFQFFWALGSTFCVCVALLVMPTLGWRWLTGIAAVPVVIFIILCRVGTGQRTVIKIVCPVVQNPILMLIPD